MNNSKIFYWEPGRSESKERVVSGVTEVEELVDELLVHRRPTSPLPGLELQGNQGDSLSIAASPTGWALIHTDAKLVQHCTKRPESDNNSSFDVKWEEITPIPAQWFIPKPLAVAGLEQWLGDGTRSPRLPWSEETF